MTVLITGNTYPVKDQLKDMGARWNDQAKGWEVPDAREAEAKALVANAPKDATPKSNGGPTYRPTKCKRCGARPDRRGWPRIYKNGVCSDCYRDDREEADMGY